jgi:hypothetical protein
MARGTWEQRQYQYGDGLGNYESEPVPKKEEISEQKIDDCINLLGAVHDFQFGRVSGGFSPLRGGDEREAREYASAVNAWRDLSNGEKKELIRKSKEEIAEDGKKVVTAANRVLFELEGMPGYEELSVE